MNKIYTLLSLAAETGKVEKYFNKLRIGLNNWDKSKVFEIEGNRVVNYTIMCDENTFTTLVNLINGTRLY